MKLRIVRSSRMQRGRVTYRIVVLKRDVNLHAVTSENWLALIPHGQTYQPNTRWAPRELATEVPCFHDLSPTLVCLATRLFLQQLTRREKKSGIKPNNTLERRPIPSNIYEERRDFTEICAVSD